jgi:hypothetical protein
MKDGDNFQDCLDTIVTSDDNSALETPVVSGVSSEVASVEPSELEESDPPQPPQDPEYDSFRSDARVYESSTPIPRAKPEWWTEAWDHLVGKRFSVLGCVEPVYPKEFKDEVCSDVEAFDNNSNTFTWSGLCGVGDGA